METTHTVRTGSATETICNSDILLYDHFQRDEYGRVVAGQLSGVDMVNMTEGSTCLNALHKQEIKVEKETGFHSDIIKVEAGLNNPTQTTQPAETVVNIEEPGLLPDVILCNGVKQEPRYTPTFVYLDWFIDDKNVCLKNIESGLNEPIETIQPSGTVADLVVFNSPPAESMADLVGFNSQPTESMAGLVTFNSEPAETLADFAAFNSEPEETVADFAAFNLLPDIMFNQVKIEPLLKLDNPNTPSEKEVHLKNIHVHNENQGSTQVGVNDEKQGSTQVGVDDESERSRQAGVDVENQGSIDMGMDDVNQGSTDMGVDDMNQGSTHMGVDDVNQGSTHMGVDDMNQGSAHMGVDVYFGGEDSITSTDNAVHEKTNITLCADLKSLCPHSESGKHSKKDGVFKCEICSKKYVLFPMFRKHMMAHLRSHKCKEHVSQVCGTTIYDKPRLNSHLKNNTEEKPYKSEKGQKKSNKEYLCEVCGKAMFQMFRLKAHLKTHSCKTDIYIEHFINGSHFKKHKKTHIGEKLSVYQCELCKDEFVNASLWKDHIEYHCVGDMFKCKVCETVCSDSLSLRAHTKVHKVQSCSVCNKTFKDKYTMSTHMTTHTGEKPHKCEICGQGFTQCSNMFRHMKTCTGENMHKCKLCGELSIHCDHVEFEVAIKAEAVCFPFKCDVCSKSFARIDSLIKHRKTQAHQSMEQSRTAKNTVFYESTESHMDLTPFQCDICKKTFTRSHSLTRHNKSVHKRDKPYKCPVCEVTFSRKFSLTSHVSTHSKYQSDRYKSKKCSICSKECSTNGNLAQHMMVHTGEKPYTCDVCGRSFTQRSTLHMHVRTHTGEKPYKCNGCDACFTQSSSLCKHKNKYHTSGNIQ